ncbi:MAG: carbohydrate binding family 9 domain-containing protein, partial [Cytophagales bacterium]|nr:carbohydrate binding family 9 domain-containing protein [Cytophagales bacterium]
PTQKRATAVRFTKAPRIDGVLGESAWKGVRAASGFVQSQPVPGTPETHPTRVKIGYDREALYIGAFLEAPSADSILRELSQRDDRGNADYFKVILDTYRDKINAYSFTVTAPGVQADSRYAAGGEDEEWDAVWESAARLTPRGWVVEMKIPFSALRFAPGEVQTWGVNFLRHVKRNGEDLYWNPVDPAVEGVVNQSGVLEGIRSIRAPLRLSLTPYVSAYLANHSARLDRPHRTTSAVVGGMDLKYGLSESFTLDVSLVPDFGQVQSDNEVLNLSPFEVQYTENRPFFQEGTDLFNKGDFFYSRRIGGPPLHRGKVEDQLADDETLLENPAQAKMLNATKVSGRTRTGLGVGVLNAITGRAEATIRREGGAERRLVTQPLSNYSVVVLDQTLKNNSFVSLVNTHVLRQGDSHDANLTGAVFKLADKKNAYALSGKGAVSRRFDSVRTRGNTGYTYTLEGGRISGTVQYNYRHHVESAAYNPNDLGILLNNNEVTERAAVSYHVFKPFWKFNALKAEVGGQYSRLHQPNRFQRFELFGSLNGTFKNLSKLDLWLGREPVPVHDFFEARRPGRVYVLPVSASAGAWYAADERKRFYYDATLSYRKFGENRRRTYDLGLNGRYRFSNHFSIHYGFTAANKYDDVGFVRAREDSVYLGRRDVKTVTNTLSGSYIFSKSMSLTLRVRHYASGARYHGYGLLTPEGRLAATDYAGDHNLTFNAFNVDMVFSWFFAPGSEVRVVWKDAGLAKEEHLREGYFANLRHILLNRQQHTLSLKVLYFLDAGKWLGKLRR